MYASRVGTFPRLIVDKPGLAREYLGGDYLIKVKWFDSQAREVFYPKIEGRYGFYAEIIRPAEARVRYTDEKSKEQTIDVDGLLSVCIQHEIDHLNGILFVDHLSSLKRNMILKKMVKAKKERVH